MNARGFTLIELLIAAALLLGVTSAVAALAAPARDAIDRSGANEAMSTGVRSALDLLTARIHEAGAPASVGTLVTLGAAVPAIAALADLDATEAVEAGQAVRLITSPPGGAQGVLAHAVGVGAGALQLDPFVVCASGGVVCGFRPGTTTVVHDEGGAAFVVVRTAAVGGALTFSPGLPRAFAAGATVVEVSTETYGIRNDGAGAFDLVRISNGGALQPILNDVVGFQVRVAERRATVQLRVQAASDSLRGPAGRLFSRAGTARHARRLVPDIDLEAVVALRNGSR